MHPSARLLLWLVAVVIAQCLQAPALSVLLLLALGSAAGASGLWWAYVRRARWLLLTLWLVVAWQTPGEAWLEVAWLPTREGLAQAGEQTLRLLAVFACLARVYAGGGRAGMLAGLWGLVAPWRHQGGERLVVRLALVLDNAQQTQPPGAWKEWLLAGGGLPVTAPDVLKLEVPAWRVRDAYCVAGGLAVLAALSMIDGML